MSKSIKNCYDKKLKFENLLEAHKRAKKGKGWKREIILYEMDLETNLINLYGRLENENYKQGKYREFYIYEPKERLIKSLPYVDRIVHQWYIKEFIKPYIMPRFIKDTYACIDERGTHKAIKTLQSYMRKMKREYNDYYVLKCDIKKYFYNINKEILFKIMQKYISDKKLLNLTKTIIFDNNELKSIPIGNYTSQYFTNIYLSELDHYIKYDLNIKYYLRFMDDFVLLLKNKNEAKEILNKIKLFLNNNLDLELNKKTDYYPSYKGVDFCGYITYETHIKVRKRCVKRIKNKIKNWNHKYYNDDIDYHHLLLCFNSFKGHISHANSYHLLNKMINKFNFDINILKL